MEIIKFNGKVTIENLTKAELAVITMALITQYDSMSRFVEREMSHFGDREKNSSIFTEVDEARVEVFRVMTPFMNAGFPPK